MAQQIVKQPRYFLLLETLKIFTTGALGSMTFGAYYFYVTDKTIENNNKLMKLENKYEMDKMQEQHKKDIKQQKKDIEQQKKDIEQLNIKFETNEIHVNTIVKNILLV